MKVHPPSRVGWLIVVAVALVIVGAILGTAISQGSDRSQRLNVNAIRVVYTPPSSAGNNFETGPSTAVPLPDIGFVGTAAAQKLSENCYLFLEWLYQEAPEGYAPPSINEKYVGKFRRVAIAIENTFGTAQAQNPNDPKQGALLRQYTRACVGLFGA